ncbi:unnamed protein product, partial [Ceratitis capitata]
PSGIGLQIKAKIDLVLNLGFREKCDDHKPSALKLHSSTKTSPHIQHQLSNTEHITSTSTSQHQHHNINITTSTSQHQHHITTQLDAY